MASSGVLSRTLADLEKSLEDHPVETAQARTYLRMAEVCQEMGMNRKAEKHAAKCIELDGKNFEAFELRAGCLIKMRKGKKALAVLDKALQVAATTAIDADCAARLRDAAASLRKMMPDTPPAGDVPAAVAAVAAAPKPPTSIPAAAAALPGTLPAPPAPPAPSVTNAASTGCRQLAVVVDPSLAEAAGAADRKSRVSAWNKKDTWEEVNVSDWAMCRLQDLFSSSLSSSSSSLSGSGSGGGGVVWQAPWGRIETTDASDFSGYAQIVHFQGRQRFLFELSFKLTWQFSSATTDQQFKGSMRLTECCQDLSLEALEADCGRFRKRGDIYDQVRAALTSKKEAAAQAEEGDDDDEKEEEAKEDQEQHSATSSNGTTCSPCFLALVLKRIKVFERELQTIPAMGWIPGCPDGRKVPRAKPPPTAEEQAAAARQREQTQQLLSDPRVKLG